MIRVTTYELMSERKSDTDQTFLADAAPKSGRGHEVHWIEIFKDRVAEDLKQVLQEDMDWMTSLPILERLNRLREIEVEHLDDEEVRKAS
jgi:hypothetical protein